MTEYQPLSFVQVKLFGNSPVIVQISPDPQFMILSSYYLLTPIYSDPRLIQDSIGSQSDFISLNKEAYSAIILYIRNAQDERIKTDDPLLVARAFWFLNQKYNFKFNPIVNITDHDIIEAINQAIESDNLIKNIHYNIAQAFQNKTLQDNLN